MKLPVKQIILTLAVVVFTAGTAGAQARGSIASGDYDSLMIAVDSKGELTGYFNEGTGDDGSGHPRFSCTFFIYGEKQVGNAYKVSTWYPGAPEDEVVTGTLKLVGKGAKSKINLHLNGEHGGCWNVAPALKDAAGVDFELTSAAKWEGVRIISPARAYFFMSPEAKAPQKIFVVKNDPVRIVSVKGDWAEVSFTNDSGKTTQGWVKSSEFYPVKPPKK
jgi:hypothetical protein